MEYIVKNLENTVVSCKKYTANKNWSVRKTKQNILMLLSHCAICGKKNRILLKTSTISIISQMISLKWINH